jgi:peptidoglycan pentaglycine glycine transferase (the first glycine)
MRPTKEDWNQFIIQNQGEFLQSWQWGEFQEAVSRQIWRIEIDNRLKGLVIKHDLPLGKNYLYCPRGPIGDFSRMGEFLAEVEKIAKKEKSIFLKIEPNLPVILSEAKNPAESSRRCYSTGFFGLRPQNDIKITQNDRFIESPKQIQPSKTIILDLAKTEQELLEAMHPKVRYNIGLAEKKGIKTEKDNQAIEEFLELLEKTGQRDKFCLHDKEYYRKIMEVLGKEGMAELFVAKYQDKIIAANLVCFFGQNAAYLHGASDYNFRNLMAPHLLQWRTILEAKQRGFRYYDFWGIDEKKWPGVTRFKKGFGGKEITHPGAFDLIYQPVWYRFYNIARKIL